MAQTKQAPTVCPQCKQEGLIVEGRNSIFFFVRCPSCGIQGRMPNGPRKRGFTNAEYPVRNQPHETKLRVLAALDVLGPASIVQIVEQSGLTQKQAQGSIARMLKYKGHTIAGETYTPARFIEHAPPLRKFPTGLTVRYQLTDEGREHLQLAREYGYISDAVTAD